MSTVIERAPVDRARPRTPGRPTVPPPRGRFSREGGWWVLMLLGIAAVHLVNIGGFPAFFDDEGTYYTQAWAAQRGSLSPYTYWYDHPPVGWVQLAGFTWFSDLFLFGRPSLVSGRLVMVGYTLVSAVLVYALSRNLGVRRGFAVAAMLTWSLSPLTVLNARQVFLDNIALTWVLLALVLATSPRKHLWHHVGAGFCFGVAVLSKETVLPLLPALLVALWHYAYRPARAFSVVGFSVVFSLTAMSYPLFAAVRNELLPGEDHVSLWDSLVFQVSGRAGSGFILAEGSKAYGQLQSWLSSDAWLVVGGLVAAFGCAFVPRLRVVAVAVAMWTLVALRPNGYLPLMYDIALLPFFAIAIHAALDGLWTRVTAAGRHVRASAADRHVRTGAAAVVLGLAAYHVPPTWLPEYDTLVTAEANSSHDDVLAFMATLPTDSVVVSDNTYWMDLVRLGWSPGWDGAVWFYKPDTDAGYDEAHPEGWRGIDYIIWNEALREDPNTLPKLRQAYANSTSLVSFTQGEDVVEVRAVDPRGTRPPVPAAGSAAPPA